MMTSSQCLHVWLHHWRDHSLHFPPSTADRPGCGSELDVFRCRQMSGGVDISAGSGNGLNLSRGCLRGFRDLFCIQCRECKEYSEDSLDQRMSRENREYIKYRTKFAEIATFPTCLHPGPELHPRCLQTHPLSLVNHTTIIPSLPSTAADEREEHPLWHHH
jgi:hypothetical protein